MKLRHTLALTCAALLLAACGKTAAPPPPAPHDITMDAVGYFCSMNLIEHDGPKGQIFARERLDTPLWFSTVRQALAYNILPDMPKGIAVIYVTDTEQQRAGASTGPTLWIDARQAFYVIESRLQGGMGGEDAFPFLRQEAAQAFAAQHGGRVLPFADIPEDYILNYESSIVPDVPDAPSAAPDASPPPGVSMRPGTFAIANAPGMGSSHDMTARSTPPSAPSDSTFRTAS